MQEQGLANWLRADHMHILEFAAVINIINCVVDGVNVPN